MKFIKSVAVATALVVGVLPIVEAASFGRSSSSSSRSSSSYSSRSSNSSTSKGGIGGTSGSMGVKKSYAMPGNSNTQPANPSPSYQRPTQQQAYQQPARPVQQPQQQQSQTGNLVGGAVAGFAGGLLGSAVGNAMFGNNHPSPPVVVVPTSGNVVDPATGNVVPGAATSSGAHQALTQGNYNSGFGFGDFLMFIFWLLVIAAIGYFGYKKYQQRKARMNTGHSQSIVDEWDNDWTLDSRSTSKQSVPNKPLAIDQFWLIQKAFASADIAKLNTLLGPDLIVEATANLRPSIIDLHSVTHDVTLSNDWEFSVHYQFIDAVSDERVSQVWHYELHNNMWMLNGIENL